MRDLHVVAVSEDGRHVLLAGTKGADKPTFRVRLDARLVSAVRGDLGAPAVDLSPKEIQARLRAGESVEQIATSAGVAVTRVERFAGPVAGEMARMIDEAREAHLVRGRRGRSLVPLGRAVDAAIADTAKPESVAWTTRREEDGRWRVQVGWVARGRAREAAWWYDLHARSVLAVDPASAALGHVDAVPQPPRRTTKPATAKPAAAAAPAKKAPRSAAPRLKVVPDPPAKPRRTKPAAPTAADERDGVQGRASVPGWADVLLGATPAAGKTGRDR